MATIMVHVRVDEKVKEDAAATLAAMGMSVSDAVRMLLLRVSAEKALPFDVRVPNAATVKAMKAGAVDFLIKPVEPATLLDALGRALERDATQRATRDEADSLRARFASLTPREREVFDRIVAGRLNKQIAGDLGIAERTVKAERAERYDPSLPDSMRWRLMEVDGQPATLEQREKWESRKNGKPIFLM